MVAFLFLVATFTLGICIAYFFSHQKAKYAQHVHTIRKPSSSPTRYTREEVSRHSKAEDLWIILKPQDADEYRVYDLTSYVDEHPGGDAILNNAGSDSTEGFFGPQHPPRVFDLIEDFCIGTLADP